MRVQTLAGRAAESEDDRAAVSQVMPTVSNGHATNSIIGAHAILMGQFVATAPSLSLTPRLHCTQALSVTAEPATGTQKNAAEDHSHDDVPLATSSLHWQLPLACS
jgi:hypothetical protein